ncbi:MAG TPA: DedA family protein [Anaerolineales bacterium]|nr:DedA family protein [Anaerolineales bacterium]
MSAWVEELVKNMGYAGLAFLTFLENVFPPIPSEIILPLGGFLAAQGRLTMLGVVLAGTVGSLAGALVLYYLGKVFSEERMKDWAQDYGGWFLINRSDVESAFSWFGKYGGWAVFVCRLIPGLRSLISLPAGAYGMKLPKFLLLTTIGTAMWSALLAFGGQLLGRQYQDLGQVISWATYAILALLIGSIALWYIQKRRDTNNRRTPSRRSEPSQGD